MRQGRPCSGRIGGFSVFGNIVLEKLVIVLTWSDYGLALKEAWEPDLSVFIYSIYTGERSAIWFDFAGLFN
ncbi:hypothetical protein DBR43_26510 [Pedobacter sp. KBW06]|nr:hypothetical protein DBR43_26510 [Pedobacter sp. KBW06]